MNKRHYEHTLPNIRGSLSNTYEVSTTFSLKETATKVNIMVRQDSLMDIPLCCHDIWHWNSA